MTKKKPILMDKRKAQVYVDNILESGKMVYELDMAQIERDLWSQPSFYIKLCETLYNRN